MPLDAFTHAGPCALVCEQHALLTNNIASLTLCVLVATCQNAPCAHCSLQGRILPQPVARARALQCARGRTRLARTGDTALAGRDHHAVSRMLHNRRSKLHRLSVRNA